MLVEDHSGNSKWMPGIILSQLGPMNYEVLVNNKVFKQHVDQILKNTESKKVRKLLMSNKPRQMTVLISHLPHDEYHPPPDTDTPNARYPSIDRRPPDRLSHNYKEGGTVVYDCRYILMTLL